MTTEFAVWYDLPEIRASIFFFFLFTYWSQVMGMFQMLKAKFRKFDDHKKSHDKSSESTKSSSQEEAAASRDIFVDPVIKKLKNAKVNNAAQ